ncbi:MAG: T9SS type A sorting domain-containing protein [Candidatus Azobacteroides sp.]|nr:T9SS type A sorting domain-containing protein [Candidatus Azobacteroides sp.]
MKKTYPFLLLAGLFLSFIPVCVAQTRVLYLNAEDGTELLEGTHGDLVITSSLSVLENQSVCFSEGKGRDLWQMGAPTQAFTIQNIGSDDVLKIEIEGILYNGAAGRSALVMCARRMNGAGDSQLTPVTNSFTTSSGTCTVYEYLAPYESGGQVSYPRHFTFSTISVANGFPAIQGIRVYTNKVVTGMQDAREDAFGFRRSGENILFDRGVQSVVLYTMSGALVRTYHAITGFSMEGLPQGMYIMRAVGSEGQVFSTKLAH